MAVDEVVRYAVALGECRDVRFEFREVAGDVFLIYRRRRAGWDVDDACVRAEGLGVGIGLGGAAREEAGCVTLR